VIRDSGDRVLVVLHSVVTDAGVISAAEHLVAGDAVVRYLRVVPRTKAFTQVLSPAPLFPGEAASQIPLRIVTAGDDMATTILDLSRELKITLLALGEPPPGRDRPERLRKVLAQLLVAGSAPILYVPPASRGTRDDLRRILMVLHAPYPAFDLLDAVVPLARRSHAELLILALPSATPLVSDEASGGSALSFAPFDPAAWLQRECARQGLRVRTVASAQSPAESVVERAAALNADLVVAGTGLADVRVGWWRRRLLDLVAPRLSCPLLFSRCA
jgi:nucleotide-binding universal stress UspA family protein